jgi:hypothetical protein
VQEEAVARGLSEINDRVQLGKRLFNPAGASPCLCPRQQRVTVGIPRRVLGGREEVVKLSEKRFTVLRSPFSECDVHETVDGGDAPIAARRQFLESSLPMLERTAVVVPRVQPRLMRACARHRSRHA